ncbi:tigger transposable element-derived protein 1-like [Anastrepha ludens]|uniref:tigger transposable element-derived protein 1-like n=1 Tax=Anastrepha ludens TaxID=28586 RepID=UPI0023B19712|nr:tigger transposable element-derived protein 1-like [Anastrepha ludens]
MEKALVMWIEDKSQKRIPVDGIAIKQTALRIYKRIKEVEPGTSSQSKQPEFSASTGERMLKPLLVNRALRPRSMKSVDFNKLPIHWTANKKAWMTSAIFTEWFQKYFISEVRRYMNAKCLEFKVLLILDNAPCHPLLEHPNVLFCYLPPNTISLIQPLDQGVNATFKKYYIKRSFQYVVDKLDHNEDSTVIDMWKKFSIMDCINQVGLALADLKPSTLNSCWKNIWPECVKSKDPDPVIHNNAVFTDITTLAHTIGGDGFDDLSFADIEELLADKSLSENEIIDLPLETHQDREHSDNDEEDPPILNATLIKEGIDLARKLGNHFQQHDPDEERAAKFQRVLKSLMASYFIKEPRDDNPETISQDDEQNNSSDGSDILVLRKRMRLLSESDNA